MALLDVTGTYVLEQSLAFQPGRWSHFEVAGQHPQKLPKY